jgi:hypothetical protein
MDEILARDFVMGETVMASASMLFRSKAATGEAARDDPIMDERSRVDEDHSRAWLG